MCFLKGLGLSLCVTGYLRFWLVLVGGISPLTGPLGPETSSPTLRSVTSLRPPSGHVGIIPPPLTANTLQ